MKLGERGQLVIPEDIRKDLNIRGNSTLVLIERRGELIVRKEEQVLREIDEDASWEALALEGLKNAWSKEDEAWEKLYKEGKI